MYPSARVLAVESENWKPEARQETIAAIANGEWDAVIIGREAFTDLPVSRETKKRFYQERIEALDQWLIDHMAPPQQKSKGRVVHDANDADRLTVSQVAKKRDALIKKLDRLMAQPKASGIAFEETGIDQIFVDESHYYKNPLVRHEPGSCEGVGRH